MVMGVMRNRPLSAAVSLAMNAWLSPVFFEDMVTLMSSVRVGSALQSAAEICTNSWPLARVARATVVKAAEVK